MPGKRKRDYDVDQFREFIEPLLEEREESYRQASMSAGLDEAALSRYFRGSKPMRDACIALADHFRINPNEMLEAAGYRPLRFFDRRLVDANAYPPDVERLAGEILQIEREDVRLEMIDILHRVLRLQIRMRAESRK